MQRKITNFFFYKEKNNEKITLIYIKTFEYDKKYHERKYILNNNLLLFMNSQ